MGSRPASLRSRQLAVWVVVGLLTVLGSAVAALTVVGFASGSRLLALLGVVLLGSYSFIVRGVDRRIRQQPVAETVRAPTQAGGGGGTLTLTRLPAYRDSLRAYRVVLDGERVGKIRNAETVTLQVGDGEHDVWLTMDWCRSRAIHLSPGENRDIVCQASTRSVLYDLTFGRTSAIQLAEG